MTLVIKNLTKKYGQQFAVKDASFTIRPGEIVGFLGPNGAGKSTTMKMITGFVSPTSGTAEVTGIDVVQKPLEAKKNIGYLPEHNPLYLDMYVKEFLTFTAGLHRIPDKDRRVDELIRITGLSPEKNKRIFELSKGYRQRIGIAQAIIHNPAVLVLDEPTSGLDPNQLKEIRGLIKQIGKDKTVLFSSHILQEVQALCDRIIIINHGEIIADCLIGEVDALIDGNKRLELQMEKRININDLIKSIPDIINVEEQGSCYIVIYQGENDIRRQIFNYAKVNDNAIMGMVLEESSIESVFSSLTANS